MKTYVKVLLVMMLVYFVYTFTSSAYASYNEKKIQEETEKLATQETEKCNLIEDSVDSTFCFAEEAVKLKQQNKDAVSYLCDKANNTDMCNYYAAFVLKDSQYCRNIKDRTGCEVASDKKFCNTITANNLGCISARAYLIHYTNMAEAESICKDITIKYSAVAQKCSMLKESTTECEQILEDTDCSYLEDEEDSKATFNDKFYLTYLTSKLMGLEIEYVKSTR